MDIKITPSLDLMGHKNQAIDKFIRTYVDFCDKMYESGVFIKNVEFQADNENIKKFITEYLSKNPSVSSQPFISVK